MRKNDDLISRQDALSFLRNWERVKDYSWGERNIIKATINEIESLPSAQSETHEERTETHACDLISRQDFDKFLKDAEKEAAKYRKYVFASALNTIRGNLRNFPSTQPKSEERKAESAQNVPKEDLISRKAAIEAMSESLKRAFPEHRQIAEKCLKALPSAQPETYKEKLKEIADALSEKFAYMNSCLNERDIILGYLGVKRTSKIHCNTDCTNIKCESYRYNKMLPSAQPEPCDDAVSREAAIDAALSAFSRGLLASPDIRKLPSVQPERKKGEWQITDAYPHNVYCSECHTRFAQTHWAVWEDGSLPRNFCPNCGADMRGDNHDQSK